MRVLRLMVRRTKRDRIRRERSRESIGDETINQKIDAARLGWLRRVWRMPKRRVARGM